MVKNLRITAHLADGSTMPLDFNTGEEVVVHVVGDDTGPPVTVLSIEGVTRDGQRVSINVANDASRDAHVCISEPDQSTLEVASTSRTSAECSDVPIRTTNKTRIVLRPMVVDNPENPQASVKGTLLFQRRGPGEEWEDSPSIPLSSLKGGDGVKLSLSSREVLRLFEALESLYQIHGKGGVPRGSRRFVSTGPEIERIAKLSRTELKTLLSARQVLSVELLAKLVAWAAGSEDPMAIARRLLNLDAKSVEELTAAVGLQFLQNALKQMKERLQSNDEEEWQGLLTNSTFVFEQVFPWPSIIVKGKAYVGGKSVLNTGGSVVDFLIRNRLTHHAALVEIKTPKTTLLGKKYRNRVYNVSEELIGSVMQVLSYKASLLQESRELLEGLPVEAFDPPCAVIIGNAQTELGADKDKTKALELFRNSVQGVSVLTFDELVARVSRQVDLLLGV